MVAKMMRWRPWPPLLSKNFLVKLVVFGLHGVRLPEENGNPLPSESEMAAGMRRFMAEVRWKGPKIALISLRRTTIKKNCTKEVEVKPFPDSNAATEQLEEVEEEEEGNDRLGVVEWNEEFQTRCTLTSYREGTFHPWEISIAVFNVPNSGHRNKVSILGTASLNLAEYATAAVEKMEIKIPLSTQGVTAEPHLSLCLALSLLELRAAEETTEVTARTIVPVPLSPTPGDVICTEKDEVSALKAGLRKVKILTDFVSTRKPRKTCREDEGSEGRCSARSEDAECTYPFDTDSVDDDLDEEELGNGKETSNIRKSFSYGTLASANYVGGSLYSDIQINGEHDDWVYYSHRRSDVGCSHAEEATASVMEQSSSQTSKRSILSWRKRKLSFRSPKPKGEPLLKAYGEEGGDDIDFDRRQLSSSDESLGWHKVDDDAVANRSSVSEFGDDSFAVGSWEMKEVVSRDGNMKICAQVFFASIDQRSERAAGESACTALVAVIADWFQTNRNMMPIKSQFDSLIRDGSLEWRKLCENENCRVLFPDKHFDLDTVLEAKIRPLSVDPRKSFIGFFHPEGAGNDNSSFDFLHGAMSFDGIWDEISRAGLNSPSDGSPQLYIVSWNDHFFVLKVDPDAYYIIDTLGERLYEGCNQAYILKFDENTTIRKMPSEDKAANGEASESLNQHGQQNVVREGLVGEDANGKGDCEKEELVCRGKDSCKEYIKCFLAAIPIGELQADIKKGLLASTPLHQRLQIEFHYTVPSKQIVAALPPEAVLITNFPQPVEPAEA